LLPFLCLSNICDKLSIVAVCNRRHVFALAARLFYRSELGAGEKKKFLPRLKERMSMSVAAPSSPPPAKPLF
jgi:hypothetical protein